GKKFAFVRFLKVDNLERLIGNLCTLWIGKFRLQANSNRFQREFRAPNSMPKKQNEGVNSKSFANVLKSNTTKSSVSATVADFKPVIVLDDSCILEKDLSCAAIGKIKDINDLSNLYVILNNEGFDNVKLKYLGGFWVMIETDSTSAKEKLIKHVGVLYWFSEFGPANSSFVNDVRLIWISLEGLPIYAWNKNALTKTLSACGTISDVDATEDASFPFKKIRIKELEVWSPEFDDEACISSSSDEESVDEENHDSMDETSVDEEKALEPDLDHEIKESTKGDDPSYPPCFTPIDASDKVEGDVANSVNQLDTKVQSCSNGMSSVKSGVNRSFNLNSGGSIMDVIENLVDIRQTTGYNMEGCKLLLPMKILSPSVGFSGGILRVWDPNIFVKDSVTISDSFVAVRGTWASSSTKLLIVSVYAPQDLSKKKRLWDYISHMIDMWNGDCIILGDFNEVRTKQESLIDIPLEGYSYTWATKSALKMSKLDRFLVSEGLILVYPSLSALCLAKNLSDHRPIILREAVFDYGPSLFRVYHSWFAKDGFVKLVEDSWKYFNSTYSCKITLLRRKFHSLKVSIKEWCKKDNQRTNERRFSIQSRLPDIDKMFDNKINLAQKAKIKWSIEGDENSKFFHGIINKKRSHLAIRGVLVEGDWIDDPIINKDVINVVREFFATIKFPPGSNSLFITLIPKKQDTNLVKDFRPISLIGSFYKIIAKILANRLSMVISDLVSDFQSAFVSNRQILDGPFILNELLSWCKNHKTKAMLFKVDFEKAFDLVRLDYLDSILSKWDRANVVTIVRMLKCFFLASGLQINIHKSMSLWSRLVSVIHGVKLSFEPTGYSFSSSPWNNIIREVGSLSSQGNYSRGYMLWRNKKQITVADKLKDTSLSGSFRRYPCGGIEEDQFRSLVDLTASVILSNYVDRWVWLLDSSGEYSVSSARTYVDDFLLPTVGSPTRWVNVVPIKINIFA
nr:RNA-directed DNA polymerase, eukaryota [Tanacetum cinerariifolium]